MYLDQQQQRKVNFENKFILKVEQSRVLNGLLEKLKTKDSYTYQHSFEVYTYSIALGEKLNLKTSDLKKLGWEALLHDIGKIDISDQILQKPGSLTELEYNKIKKHPLKGVRILTQNNILGNLKTAILEHHENFDGSGYPFGISKREISLHARIIRIADSFSSMTNDRVYKSAMSLKETITELREQAGKQFDPKLVRNFIKILTD